MLLIKFCCEISQFYQEFPVVDSLYALPDQKQRYFPVKNRPGCIGRLLCRAHSLGVPHVVIEKPTLFVTGNYGVEPVEALLAKRPQRECLANANGVVVI